MKIESLNDAPLLKILAEWGPAAVREIVCRVPASEVCNATRAAHRASATALLRILNIFMVIKR